MNFRNIRKYPTYESYNKIKKLKHQQAFAAFKKIYKHLRVLWIRKLVLFVANLTKIAVIVLMGLI